MRQLSDDEIKQYQLKILDLFTQFCDEHQLKYFLTGGTLIGAIRHKGYIPWDDDIDLSLLRSDYEYLLTNQDKLPKNLKLYSHIDYPDYPFPFLKIGETSTVLKQSNIDFELNVNIDIFPIDSIPAKHNLLMLKIRLYRVLLKVFSTKNQRNNNGRIKKMWIQLARLIYKNRQPVFFIKKIEASILKYKNNPKNPYRGIIAWGYRSKEIVPKETFDTATLVEFEGRYYQAPEKYDLWLRHVYGDYMTLPPQEKRIKPHSGITVYQVDT